MTEINCVNVSVKCITKNNIEMMGVFSNISFKKGDLIEYGLARVLNNVDGNDNPYLFTWSDNIPNKTWALLSGCATFYNTSLTPNIEFVRDFNHNIFKVRALEDIDSNTELVHTYKSLKWRGCFKELFNSLN